jgi:predicted 3-demethylubiquinone-9 3-methyltransferase (glyoxalase superfamily)
MPSSITPCLWFDVEAEEAANFYTSFFKNSKITHIQRYGEDRKDNHGHAPGSVMVAAFELDGQSFTALNGGPQFHFNEAISFQIECADQAEVDHYWAKLTEGADPARQRCGWVADKFGVCWQVVPKVLKELIASPDREKSERTYKAMMGMKKFDIAALKRAYDGEESA